VAVDPRIAVWERREHDDAIHRTEALEVEQRHLPVLGIADRTCAARSRVDRWRER
jgi:hypothetical protein